MADTYAHADVLRYGADIIKQNATQMSVCGAMPTTRQQAIDTHKLAITTVANGDFTWSESVGVGQLLIIAAKTGIIVDTGGTMYYIAIVDVTRLLVVFKVTTSQPLTAGNLLNLPEFKIAVLNPE